MRERLNAHLWRCDRCDDECTMTEGRPPDGWSTVRHPDDAERTIDICTACTEVVQAVLRTPTSTAVGVGDALGDLTTRHLAALDVLHRWREALHHMVPDDGRAPLGHAEETRRLSRCINELAEALEVTPDE